MVSGSNNQQDFLLILQDKFFISSLGLVISRCNCLEAKVP